MAQARAGNLAAAVRGVQEAIARDPGNKELLVRLADVQQLLGNPQAVVNLLSEARSKGLAEDPVLLKRELLVSLYLSPPEGFTKAIATSEKLMSLPAEEKDPWVHLWYAAAQGQRFAYAKARGSADAEDARTKALAAVNRVLELAPDPDLPVRRTLREIYDPAREGAPADDNDLEVFKGDRDFDRSIYGGR
jgi:tetratricopeptide (TPR) repeat protein